MATSTRHVSVLEAAKATNAEALSLMRQAEQKDASSPQGREGLLRQAREALQGALSTLQALEGVKAGAPSAEGPTADRAALHFAAQTTSAAELQGAMALTLNNLACVHRRVPGHEEAALQCLQRAAAMEAALFGGRPRCATLLNSSTVLLALGRADEAVAAASDAVAAAREERGTPEAAPEHLCVALHNYAMAQQHCSQAHERRHHAQTMRQALEEAHGSLGAAHPTTRLIARKCESPAATFGGEMLRPVSSTAPSEGTLTPHPPPQKAPLKAPTKRVAGRPKDYALRAIRESVERRVNPEEINAAVAAAVALRQSSPPRPPVAEPTSERRPTQLPEPLLPALVTPAGPVPLSSVAPDPSVEEPQQEECTDVQAVKVTPSAGLPAATRKSSLPMLYSTTKASRAGLAQPPQATATIGGAGTIGASVAAQAAEALPFVRFMPVSACRDIPVPLTFCDVRAQFTAKVRGDDDLQKLRTRNAGILSGAPMTGPPAVASAGVAAPASAPAGPGQHKARGSTLAERRAARAEEEQREEARLRQQRKKLDEQLRKEQERRQRLARLGDARRNRAAVVIQRAYRSWRRRVGLQRRHEGRIQAAGVPRIFPCLVRCAQKWLDRSAGRRLVCRLRSGDPSLGDYASVVARVTRLQCLWRCVSAKKAVANLRARRTEFLAARRGLERHGQAAGVIQSAFRRSLAQKGVAALRVRHYTGFVVKIQRFVRSFLRRSRRIRAALMETSRARRSATAIQRTWRGYQGRLVAVMRKIRAQFSTTGVRDRSRAAIERRLLAARLPPPDPPTPSAVLTHARDRSQSPPRLHSTVPERVPVETTAAAPPTELPRRSERAVAYRAAAADRAEEAAQEHQRDAAPLEAMVQLRVQQDFELELAERFHAPTAVTMARIRAEEALQRDLERTTLTRVWAAVRIQRAVRWWQRTLRFDEKNNERLVYLRANAQQRNYDIRRARHADEAHREYLRTHVADTALPVREARAAIATELSALEALVRHELAVEDVRSVQTRTRDAATCKLAEVQVSQRASEDAKELRSVGPACKSSAATFLTARERLRQTKADHVM